MFFFQPAELLGAEAAEAGVEALHELFQEVLRQPPELSVGVVEVALCVGVHLLLLPDAIFPRESESRQNLHGLLLQNRHELLEALVVHRAEGRLDGADMRDRFERPLAVADDSPPTEEAMTLNELRWGGGERNAQGATPEGLHTQHCGQKPHHTSPRSAGARW